MEERTLGQHLASRLVSIGVSEFFGVPGDYNLQLLDELEKEEGLRGVWCCNELNAGYAADGYARTKGIGCLVVTFTVGGLSALNAVAGAYAEDQPVVVITGGPNSNDWGSNRVVHHTIGKPHDYLQERDAMRTVTEDQVVINSLGAAHELIDHALSTMLATSKPVYISIACNLAGLPHPSFAHPPIPYVISTKLSNPQSLEAAVKATVTFLQTKIKPVLVAGPKLRRAKATKQFLEVVEASGAAFAVQPAAKGLVPEGNPGYTTYMGTYWGQMSSAYAGEVVESADAVLIAGGSFNDYATAGYSLNLQERRLIRADPYRVTIAGGQGGQVFGCVRLDDFLFGLAKRVAHNPTSIEIYRRLYVPPPEIPTSEPGSPLQAKVLFKHVQGLLSGTTILLAETGDSVFQAQRLCLPDGCAYEWSQQYGSIGWSVGAALGCAVAGAREGRRVVACIGDGSFQMTAQEVSTMLHYRCNPIIILVNNTGYTIESQIHEGPYNRVQNWGYTALVEAFACGGGAPFTAKVATEDALVEALRVAQVDAVDKLCLIECIIHKDDCSQELLEWGARVAAANARPPAK